MGLWKEYSPGCEVMLRRFVFGFKLVIVSFALCRLIRSPSPPNPLSPGERGYDLLPLSPRERGLGGEGEPLFDVSFLNARSIKSGGLVGFSA